MAITQTVLGPNSSYFTLDGTDSTASIMVTLSDAIVAGGWELFDAAAPQGLTGTTPVGRVFRALQDGSATQYKYVGLSLNTTSMVVRIYESWNATTHVGTNEGSVATQGSAVSIPAGMLIPMASTVSGTAIFLFVNPRWLAVRARSNTLAYSHMVGAFEYKKDFGEAESIPSVIFMTTYSMSSYLATASNGIGYGAFGGCRNAIGQTGNTGIAVNNITTAYGHPLVHQSSTMVQLDTLLTAVTSNVALTMTAVNMTSVSSSYIRDFRGRIFGLKLIAGTSSWNDMDTVQLAVDSDNFQSTNGTPITHNYLGVSASYLRFLLPQ